jgi:flagellar assembly protein FliH
MNSSTSASPRTTILRGDRTTTLTLATMNADLRNSPFTDGRPVDARFVDPTLAKAFEEARLEAREEAKIEGFEAGYAEGVQAGRRDGEAAAEHELVQAQAAEAARAEAVESTLSALGDAATTLATRQVATLDGIEDLLLSAAYDLATTLLGRELESFSSPVRDALRRALTMLPDDGIVTVSVHPVDAATLSDIADIAGGRTVRVVADANVEPGSCIADSGQTRVDASLAAALQRVRDVLTP